MPETIPIILVLTSESGVQKTNEKKGPVKMMMCLPLNNNKKDSRPAIHIYMHSCFEACMAPSGLHLGCLVMGKSICRWVHDCAVVCWKRFSLACLKVNSAGGLASDFELDLEVAFKSQQWYSLYPQLDI